MAARSSRVAIVQWLGTSGTSDVRAAGPALGLVGNREGGPLNPTPNRRTRPSTWRQVVSTDHVPLVHTVNRLDGYVSS